MKKILYIFSALVLLASCQKDAGVLTSDEAVVTYDVKAPIEFEIKSAGQGTAINALWYGVYHKKDDTYRYMSDMSDFVQVTDINDISVPITLFKDQEYKIIFVAQHIEPVPSADGTTTNRYTYNINSDGDMSLNPEALITDGEQLDGEQFDAFVYWEQTGVIQNDSKKNVTLNRPLAQINLGTSQTSLPTDIDIDITLSNVSASYNIFERTFSTETTTLTFNDIARTDQTVTVNSINYAGLTTLYVLAGNNIDMQISLDGNSKTINNIAIAENYKTNIVGNI